MTSILHIINGLEMGGAERSLLRRVQQETGRYSRVNVVSIRDPGHFSAEIDNDVDDLRHLGITSPDKLMLLPRRLKSVVKEFSPDLIHGWQYYGSLAATLAHRFASSGTPCIWNIRHSLYDLKLESRRIRAAVRLCRATSWVPHAVVYNSNSAHRQHLAYGFKARATQVIPNGFDCIEWAPDSAVRVSARQRLNIQNDDLVIGHVARFHPMKNHAGFIEAALQVLRKFPEALFVMVGRDITFENRTLRSMIPSEYVDRFRLVGACDDVAGVMQAFDAFCLSSAWGEGCPNVLGEAMAIGLPCVATDVGDSRALVGDTGVIARSSASSMLARAISELSALTRVERQRLGAAARERVCRYYSAGRCMGAYDTLYEQLRVPR